MDIDNHQGWYVVFCKTNKPHWLLNWLGDISHCYAYAKSPGGSYYIVVNSSWTNLTVTMLFADEFPDMKEYTGKDSVIIKHEGNATEEGKHSFFGLFTCVSATKRLLGINKRFIITPRQLMRYLQ